MSNKTSSYITEGSKGTRKEYAMPGAFGQTGADDGAIAETQSSAKSGIFARNDATNPVPPGTPGAGGNGVFGLSTVPNASGVFGANNNGGIGVGGHSDRGIGVFGSGGHLAGQFEGNVEVNGTITTKDVVLSNAADCAEDFDVAPSQLVEPGTVMVLDEEGMLRQSHQPYDKRVAGVISGAGEFRAGIVLDRQQSKANRMPIALVGKVYCRVDARFSPIAVGDMLTTSPTAGHAMKAEDPSKAFGSVIGKALRSLEAGRGMIPILIALQ